MSTNPVGEPVLITESDDNGVFLFEDEKGNVFMGVSHE